ncbi:MAG TPA: sialidase family protein [Rhodanobacteraceae bacterium]
MTHATNGLAKQNLATRYVGGYPQYRIPALAVTTKGTLIAAYDARPSMADLPSHIAVVMRRSTDGGKSWGPQKVIRAAPAPDGFGDPSLLVDRRTGRVFVFYAASVNAGFASSKTGNNPNDPDIQQVDYSYSDDDGLTWHARRITRKVKNPAWGGLFAASGEGIQLRQGPYKGRLIQQYVIRIKGGNYAASLYSDNDGKTWTMGQPVGPGMDENKVVGLANGDVLLDVRAAPRRLFAISHNGGQTWSKPHPVPALVDPGDNGAIIRYAPNAPASNPQSRRLIESNTADPDIRRNLTVRMSCDDGKTWPIARVIEPGSSAYSTLTLLPDGRIGLFYERDGYRHLTFASFSPSWLDGVCAPIKAASPAIMAGSHHVLHVRVSNQTPHTLAAGTLTLQVPFGWTAQAVSVPAITKGHHANIDLPYTASANRIGTLPLTLLYTTAGKHSVLALTASIKRNPTAPTMPSLSVRTVLDHLTAAGATGLPGDVAHYWTRVTNTGNAMLIGITLRGNLQDLSRCRRATLAPGASFLCWRGQHQLTADDRADGRYMPRLTATATTIRGRQLTASIMGQAITFTRPVHLR